MTREREVDIVFDRLEDACPTLFRPRHLVTVHEGDVWRRLYGGTDIFGVDQPRTGEIRGLESAEWDH